MKFNNVLLIEKLYFQVVEEMQKPTSCRVTQVFFQGPPLIQTKTS